MKRITEINPAFLDKKLIGMMDKKQKNIRDYVFDVKQENRVLLEMGERFYSDLRSFRERRKRVRNYIRGDQWKDVIKDPSSDRYITEEQHIKDQGIVPMKQNLMRNLMKNISGQWQQNPSKSNILSNKKSGAKVGEMLTNTLYYAHQINDMEYLLARLFDEFNISGFPIVKVLFQYRSELERPDMVISQVDPRRFIFNTDISDPKMTDVYYICEIIDAPIESIVSSFARTKEHEKIIRDIYVSADTFRQNSLEGMSPTATDSLDYYVPYEPGKCRVYANWYKENEWGYIVHDPLDTENGYSFEKDIKGIQEENQMRLQLGLENGMLEEDIALIEAVEHNAELWKYKFLSPQGYCLSEGDSPYEHGEHPYAFLGYPMIDGQIWGPLEDVIDQQRNVNRYFTMMDMIQRASAKGTWIIPETAKPDELSKAEMQGELVKIGGVLWYQPSDKHPNAKPEQIFTNATPVGLIDMMNIQMRLMQEVSGVYPSAQGQPGKPGTSGVLYAQEAANSATNLIDSMNAFGYFIKKMDTKIVKTIIQFYKEKRLLHIAGTDYEREAMEFDPDLVDGFDFDLTVTPGVNAPIYRQMMDKTLYDLLMGGAINIEMFLENTSLPFAGKLLESIKQQQQDVMSGQQATAPAPELAEQINSMANPEAMNMINQSFQ